MQWTDRRSTHRIARKTATPATGGLNLRHSYTLQGFMGYFVESYYISKKDFPTLYAIKVTAKTIARFSPYFYAEPLSPAPGQIIRKRFGLLPSDLSERETFVCDLVEWLFENSDIDFYFTLLLDNKPPFEYLSPKFGYYDVLDVWNLNLSEAEFAQLQSSLVEHNLPADLFYPEHLGVCVKLPKTGLLNRLLPGWHRCYTPKEWEEEQKKLGKG
jgi:hypothetical protein